MYIYLCIEIIGKNIFSPCNGYCVKGLGFIDLYLFIYIYIEIISKDIFRSCNGYCTKAAGFLGVYLYIFYVYIYI